MKEQLESKKDMNDFKIVIPMSDETIKKIKVNTARTLLGVTIANMLLTSGGQSIFAESLEAPHAIEQSVGTEGNTINKLLVDDERVDGQSEPSLDISEERNFGIQRAPQESTDPNYAEDEKNVGTYKETQLERGNGPYTSYDNLDEENRFIDGYRYNTLEPGATSPDKTLWGFEIEFDRDQGQRTYTDFTFTNSGLLAAFLPGGTNEDPEKVPSVQPGIKIGNDFKEASYKANTSIDLVASRQQRNLNLYASEEDLKHINSIDTNNTTMAWEGKYKKDNTNTPRATQGTSAVFSFTVNPWPNENDSLELMKLNGEYKEKVFVQGQEFDTGIRIDNIDDNARERLVGQVYHPTTGEIVPGASAYIGENGTIHIKMPKGALKKDPTGLKYVVDDESIFSTDAYKGLQNLDVKFFARPRTADEFRAIVENNGGY